VDSIFQLKAGWGSSTQIGSVACWTRRPVIRVLTPAVRRGAKRQAASSRLMAFFMMGIFKLATIKVMQK
jgi:hypothetical protein